MRFSIVCIVIALKLVSSRYAPMQHFVVQDNVLDEDLVKKWPPPVPVLNTGPYNRNLPSYVKYQIMPPPSSNRISTEKPDPSTPAVKSNPSSPAEKPSSESNTPANSNSSEDEIPRDLLEIAEQKLGIKNKDEIPSLSELGQLFGTTGSKETIAYIREMMATDQGVALIKAFIESSDYTDNDSSTVGSTPDQNDWDDYDDSTNQDEDDTNDDIDDYEDLPDSVSTSNNQAPGLWQRMAAYFNIYNLLPQYKKTVEPPQFPQLRPEANRFTSEGKRLLKSSIVNVPTEMKPLLVRKSRPYQYPIPIRPFLVQKDKANAYARQELQEDPILRTILDAQKARPTKSLVTPYMQQLAKIVKIPLDKLEPLLLHRQNLAEMITSLQFASLIDTKMIAAVERALMQDKDMDLKKLLNNTAAQTLK